MLDTIKEIICEYVEIEPEDITPESSLRYDIGASSFDLMNIAVAIEEKFDIKISNAAMPKVKTVGDVAELLKAKLATN